MTARVPRQRNICPNPDCQAKVGCDLPGCITAEIEAIVALDLREEACDD